MVAAQITELTAHSRLALTLNFMQHGHISVFEHCVEVAYMSCRLASSLRLNVDYTSLIRGALLHDYFLYDWHDAGDGSHHFHGFTHPRRALENAMRDIALNETEQAVILRHMFPLTPIPPDRREAWLVCLADKICATMETLHMTQIKSKTKYGAVR